MSYCTNCGQQLSDGVKFCSECGAPVGSGSTGEYKNREQVYVGVVKKCPVCGEELPSMAAVCPSCGHEINSTQVHSALQKFIDELDFCDRSVADDEALLAITGEKESERGWRSWSTVAKVLWVIVNCLALCVPLVVYYLLRSRQSHRFAPSVKRKASLIENFQIPSERQAILESLYFIRDKVVSLATQKMTSDTAYWAKLWGVKSEQIFKKAQVAIPNDVSVSGLFHEIESSVQQIKSAQKRKNIITISAIIAHIAVTLIVEIFVFSRILHVSDIFRSLSINWGICVTLLLAFCIWTIRKIPDRFKGIITAVMCIIVLVFLMKSCQDADAEAKEYALTFTTQIGSMCSDHGMILANVDMNKLTKRASIEVLTSAYDKPSIDKAEADFFDIAREYKFELKVVFIDEDDLTIRESEIDEYGVVKRSTDNTNGIIGFVKEKCKENGAKLDRIYNNQYNNVIKFYIEVPTTDSYTVMDNMQEEIYAVRTQFGYSGYEIEFRTMDKYSGDLLRTIEISEDGSVSIEERMKQFDQSEIDAMLEKAILKCKEQKISMVIKVTDEHWQILWKSFIDANGKQICVDVYHFQNEVQTICEKNGAILDSVRMYNEEMSLTVYVNSWRRGKIDDIEAKIIEAYQKYSDLKELSIEFWDEKRLSEYEKVEDMDLEFSKKMERLEKIDEKYKIRDTEVDSSGVVSHSIDNTKLL